MEITAATAEQFDGFLALYGYVVEDADKSRLLALSLVFLSSIEICKDGPTDQAQCFLAYAMSDNGGGFNPAAVSAEKVLTKKGLGRNAIVKEWAVNDELAGTDPLSLLKRVPLAYGLLKPLLCAGATGIGNIEITR